MAELFRPYPWWTRIWPLGRIYFAGWQRGEEAGTARGRWQMGDNLAFEQTGDNR